MENLPNPPWEGWQTVREIGSGSYGTVYEISRTLLNGKTESAAMKMMSLPTKKTEIDRLYRSGYTKERIAANYRAACENITEEYSLMRKLYGCVNIVSCDDIHYEPHTDDIGWDIFIRMELLTPLEDVLTDSIPESTVLRLACDLCKALEECKKHNIVHRDIKPQNLFISADGDYKLGDFGIAREMEATEQGTRIGTFNYIPPEVYFGKEYGSRADIYSLGIVLYWMLNERVIPFAQKSTTGVGMQGTEEARKRRMAGEALPPPAHGSAELQRIVLKACAYEPEDRYASATEMLADLNKASNMILKIPDAYQNIGYEDKKDKKQPKNKNKSGPKNPQLAKIIGLTALAVVLLVVCLVIWKPTLAEPGNPAVGDDNHSSLTDEPVDEATDVVTDTANDTQPTAAEATTQATTVAALPAKEPDRRVRSTPAYADVDDEYDGEPLNMRTGPSGDYELLTTVPDESHVVILGYADSTDDWIFVGYNGYNGWILSKYVSEQQQNETIVAQDENLKIATAFASAHASSTLPSYGWHTYNASNVLRQDARCWCENSETDGTGEWITLYLPEKQLLQGLKIVNGYAGTASQYESNAKVKDIRIEFSDGRFIETSLRVFTTADRTTVQSLKFSEAVATEYVKIIIKSVTDGHNEDACITYIAPY